MISRIPLLGLTGATALAGLFVAELEGALGGTASDQAGRTDQREPEMESFHGIEERRGARTGTPRPGSGLGAGRRGRCVLRFRGRYGAVRRDRADRQLE